MRAPTEFPVVNMRSAKQFGLSAPVLQPHSCPWPEFINTESYDEATRPSPDHACASCCADSTQQCLTSTVPGRPEPESIASSFAKPKRLSLRMWVPVVK